MLTADTSSSPRMARRLSVSMSWSSWTNRRLPVGILSFARAWNMKASSGSGEWPTRMSWVMIVLPVSREAESSEPSAGTSRTPDTREVPALGSEDSASRLNKYLGRRSGPHHPAGLHPMHGGRLPGEVHVVGDDDHRLPVPGQGA